MTNLVVEGMKYLGHQESRRQKDNLPAIRLRTYAEGTFNSILAMEDAQTGLPHDRLIVTSETTAYPVGHTSPTNLGLYLTSLISARDMELIDDERAEGRIAHVIRTIKAMPEGTAKKHGLLVQWHDVQECKPATHWEDGEPVEQHLSSVDNAILALSLVACKGAYPHLAPDIDEFLGQMEFQRFYDKERNLLHGRIDINQDGTETVKDWYYDVLNTDGRLGIDAAVAIFGLPPQLYTNMGRVAPASSDNPIYKQTQNGVVRSWNGTQFERALPAMFVPEILWAPHSYGRNANSYVDEQRQYGMSHTHNVWGYSSSYGPDGKYHESGVPSLGMNPCIGMPDYITPHAIAAGLDTDFAPESIKLLTTLERLGLYNENFGFPDGIRFNQKPIKRHKKSIEASNIRCLPDQVMMLLSINAYLERLIGEPGNYTGLQKYTGPFLENSLRGLISEETFAEVLH